MRTPLLAAGWTAAALFLAAGPAPGQPADDGPYLFVSPIPLAAADLDKTPSAPVREINLRPNQDQPYFVYAHNPTDADATLKVVLVSNLTVGGKTVPVPLPGGVLAEGIKVPAKKTVQVAVSPKTPAGPADKAAPPPAVALAGNSIALRATREDGTQTAKDVVVSLAPASGYTNVTPVTGKDSIGFKVEREGTRSGGPIPVRLAVLDKAGDPFPAGRLAAEGNVLAGSLAAGPLGDGAQQVDLALKTDKVPDDAVIEVSVDGTPVVRYGRDGKRLTTPPGVYAPAAWEPGKPFPVRVAADGAADVSPNTALEVVLAAPSAKDAKNDPREFVRRVPGPRDDGIDLRAGPTGEAVFVTRSRDRVVEFPTQGVYGKRQVFVRNPEGARRQIGGKKDVLFDGTPPGIEPKGALVRPAAVPQAWYRPGQRVVLTAAVSDPESGVDRPAVFSLGGPPGPDGKPAPGGQILSVTKDEAGGTPDLPTRTSTAGFDIPAAVTRDGVKVWVTATNRAGLTGSEEFKINVDPTPPEVSPVTATVSRRPARDPAAPAGAPDAPAVLVDPAATVGGVYRPGETVRLTASATDPESGVDQDNPAKVVFFLGDPPGPDGKPAQGTIAVFHPDPERSVDPGVKGIGKGPVWAADFTLPKDVAKDVDLKVGAQFVNGAGMVGTRVGTIRVEPEPKDLTVGVVKVKVVKGGNEVRQPGVPVRLVDPLGQVAAEAKTDECGRAVFPKVLPGRYRVLAFKPEDGNAYDVVPVTVIGGTTTEVDLSIHR